MVAHGGSGFGLEMGSVRTRILEMRFVAAWVVGKETLRPFCVVQNTDCAIERDQDCGDRLSGETRESGTRKLRLSWRILSFYALYASSFEFQFFACLLGLSWASWTLFFSEAHGRLASFHFPCSCTGRNAGAGLDNDVILLSHSIIFSCSHAPSGLSFRALCP
jgi:hypothetical protein